MAETKKKINNQVYIMQINASKIEFIRNTTKDSKVTPKDLAKNFNTLFIGTLPHSMEVQYLKQNFPNEFATYTKKDNSKVWYTECIIDIVFKGSYKVDDEEKTVTYISKNGEGIDVRPKKKTITTTDDLRKAFYTKGFSLWIDGKERKYVFYLRGASKVKEGHCLFIDAEYAQQVQEWGFMELDFTKDTSCDMTSLFAYRSLTTSGIIGNVKIKVSVKQDGTNLLPQYGYNPGHKQA